MFCSKEVFHRLNNIHERYLRLIHQDYISNFVTFLINANEKSVHQKCLEFLMIEGYKFLNGLWPQIINDIFKLRKNTHNLKNIHLFESQNATRARRLVVSLLSSDLC